MKTYVLQEIQKRIMYLRNSLNNFLIFILIVDICIVGGGMDILPGPSGQSFLGEPSGSLDSGQGKILPCYVWQTEGR